MFNLKNLFARAMLALMLVTGAGAASAGPTYQVTIDTQGLSGVGQLDFAFLGLESAGAATAYLSNFSGDFGDFVLEGDASGDRETGITLGNSVFFNDYLQAVNLGGVFRFNVMFDFAGEGDGMTLGVALYDELITTYLGAEGNLVQFDLMPGSGVTVSAVDGLSRVAEVPEPASMAMLLAGLMLLGWTMRQRRMR
ncbi:NF038129 family PEP-CTERM protein [Massilia sp. YIM B02769]|uniref:NF038129 family PEP-CTERM protein n=1 Tax=unclassified Massilia TaxID=2609279 RepID=UPI0025B6F786|nr:MULTISPECIES: NF038129 family PEP-CTERM protein [unclassified Massilia]MDN4059315.1 NF038129 family PEP-CTERM protein [Massilia sp. YIM B02769]